MNPNWARWVFASVADALKQVATENNLPVLVEHLDDRTPSFMNSSDRAEIRITGPFAQKLSTTGGLGGYYRLWVDANVLLTSRYDGDQKNGYSILQYAGQFQEAMDGPIAVWNYGGEPGDYDPDDPSSQIFLGCLLPRDGKNDSVRVLNFGQADKTDKIKQTEVDARYYIYLDDN